MVALGRQRAFDAIRATLALAEERGDGIAVADAARAVGIDETTVRALASTVLFLAFHTRDEFVDASRGFLLTVDDRIVVDEGHWLRGLASEPPDADAALALLVAGLAMQSVASAPTPDLDAAVEKLRDVVAADLEVSVSTPPCLPVAQQARREERSLRFRYVADRDGASTDREVLPHRVFSKWGHWYVTGRELGAAGTKQFRVDRMLHAEVGDVEFDAPLDSEIPEWFDLRAHERTIRLRCALGQLRAIPRPVTIGPTAELADGRVEVDVTISGDRRLDWMLVALDPSTEIVSPPEAVARRRDHARRVLARLTATT